MQKIPTYKFSLSKRLVYIYIWIMSCVLIPIASYMFFFYLQKVREVRTILLSLAEEIPSIG